MLCVMNGNGLRIQGSGVRIPPGAPVKTGGWATSAWPHFCSVLPRCYFWEISPAPRAWPLGQKNPAKDIFCLDAGGRVGVVFMHGLGHGETEPSTSTANKINHDTDQGRHSTKGLRGASDLDQDPERRSGGNVPVDNQGGHDRWKRFAFVRVRKILCEEQGAASPSWQPLQ